MNNNNITAPKLDCLLSCFDDRWVNQTRVSGKIKCALQSLFDTLHDLKPLPDNDEVKAIWLIVPRGDIKDYGSFEEAKGWGDVNTYEDWVRLWKEEYPDESVWYELVIAENTPNDRYKYMSVSVGKNHIINADLDNNEHCPVFPVYKEETLIELIEALAVYAGRSMAMLKEDTYNEYVEKNLPYCHRTGVIRRSDLWTAFPEHRENIFEGLDDETYEKFRRYVKDNDESRISRMKTMTANDFFRACAIGYAACGYKGTDLPLAEQYLKHADGRDEGLTGAGYGLDEGPGIDPDDPDAWNEWYFHRKHSGGHPWEVCSGGNSTHIDMYVCHDVNRLGWMRRTGELTDNEYDLLMKKSGYYFKVRGSAWNRSVEAIKFFVAIREAGLPVIIDDGEAILARLEGTDLVGIVPWDVIPTYCESLFPARYGEILDFMHVYSDEYEKIKNHIEWLPVERAEVN